MIFVERIETYFYRITQGVRSTSIVQITFVNGKFKAYEYDSSVTDPKEDIKNITKILKEIEKLKEKYKKGKTGGKP